MSEFCDANHGLCTEVAPELHQRQKRVPIIPIAMFALSAMGIAFDIHTQANMEQLADKVQDVNKGNGKFNQCL